MIKPVCGKRMWSYQHWTCQRPKHLWGRHRFNNYTGTRIPRVWRVKSLYRYWKGNRRLSRLDRTGKKGRLLDYRQVLFPDKYEPVPIRYGRAGEVVSK